MDNHPDSHLETWPIGSYFVSFFTVLVFQIMIRNKRSRKHTFSIIIIIIIPCAAAAESHSRRLL